MGGSPSSESLEAPGLRYVLDLEPGPDATLSAQFFARIQMNHVGCSVDPRWTLVDDSMRAEVVVHMPRWFVEAYEGLSLDRREEVGTMMDHGFRRAVRAGCSVCPPGTDPDLVRVIVERQAQLVFDSFVLPEAVAMMIVD